MKRERGSPKSAIWLLADSPPRILLGEGYEGYEPLDWRFPTRHNIWTPIETIVNRELFRLLRERIDDSKFYVRNAVESPENWKHKNKHILEAEIADFRKLVKEQEHQPCMILTFGRRAFEFARRSQGEKAQPFSDWRIPELLREFDTRLARIRDGTGILLPLLHAVVARKFETCHDPFRSEGDTKNYYEHVGCELATFLQGQFGNERFRKLLIDGPLPCRLDDAASSASGQHTLIPGLMVFGQI